MPLTDRPSGNVQEKTSLPESSELKKIAAYVQLVGAAVRNMTASMQRLGVPIPEFKLPDDSNIKVDYDAKVSGLPLYTVNLTHLQSLEDRGFGQEQLAQLVGLLAEGNQEIKQKFADLNRALERITRSKADKHGA